MKQITLIALVASGYMSESLPTVSIKTENGPVLINESDFDPETMELVDAVEAPVTPEPAVIPATNSIPTPVTPETVPAVATPEQLLVMKSGRKFFITNTMGVKLEGDAAEQVGIDPEGYTTEAGAQAALAALNA